MANSQRYHREIGHRYRLEAQKFDSGYVTLARRYIDPTTGSKNYEDITLSGEGTILTYTIIHIPADAYANAAPFPIAIIETDEGARLTAQVIDCPHEDVKIGARVKLVFRKIMEEGHSGIINYGYKAVLI
jgi:uncharacterized OB-fold protein